MESVFVTQHEETSRHLSNLSSDDKTKNPNYLESAKPTHNDQTPETPTGTVGTSHNLRLQVLAILIGNIISLCHGMSLGWLSPIVPTLESNDSPLRSGPVTLEQLSWIGAFYAIGTLVGNCVFGPFANFMGRKNAVTLMALPNLLFWLLVLFGDDVILLYIARIFAGLVGGGLYICMPLYTAEIADNRIRGRLNSLLTLTTYVGIFFGFITGTYLSYYTVPKIPLALPIVFFVIFSFFPETPQHFIARNNLEKAKKSLRFYRNCCCSDENECAAISVEFKEILQSEQEHLTQSGTNVSSGSSTIKNIFKKRSIKTISIGLSLIAINLFSGSFAMMHYMASILMKSGLQFDSNTSSIVIAGIQIGGVYGSTLLVDRIGRKTLFLISTFGSFVGMSSIGIYSYFFDHGYDLVEYSWIPLVSFAFVRFIMCIGILPIPFVVIPEILPTEVRKSGSMICMLANSIFGFITIKMFPILMDSLHLYGVMGICAGVCLLGSLFTIFILPETKGKNLNESQSKSSPSEERP